MKSFLSALLITTFGSFCVAIYWVDIFNEFIRSAAMIIYTVLVFLPALNWYLKNIDKFLKEKV